MVAFKAMICKRRKAKVAYVGGPDLSLRIPLINKIRPEGFDVHSVGSELKDAAHFAEIRIPYHLWQLKRRFNVAEDIRSLLSLYRLFRRERFMLVHAFDTKPTVLGRVAARLAGTPVIVGTIPGMGTLFSDGGRSNMALRCIYVLAHRVACAASDMTVFQNTDDMDYFLSKRIVQPHKAVLIRGSGVDVEKFAPALRSSVNLDALTEELSLCPDRVNFFMISRMVRHKGVREYMQAAKIIKSLWSDKADFYLVGPLENSLAAIPEETLRSTKEVIRYIGPRTDVLALLRLADVVVLPSYYREGIPRILLEASAMEVPVITTLMPGCKEVVEDGLTGYTVAPRDSRALAKAMDLMIRRRSALSEMGKRAREKIIKEFSLEKICVETVRLYNTLLKKLHSIPKASNTRSIFTDRSRN
jgi:glycosyltransferase involved in cell wall biosynthesis